MTIVLSNDAEPLTTELARQFGVVGERLEAARVSQAIATLNGAGLLYDALHLLLAPSEPSTLHRFLASVPALLRARSVPCPLFVTTGYDLSLERALVDAGESFDTVGYVATGPHRGGFAHVSPTGDATPIERPNTFATELALEERSVVLHLQGRLDDSPARDWESFAITEDDFIHYGDVATRLPVVLAARLRRTHLLLLGHTLSDWTLRVVLERLWGEEPLPYHSWSVHAGPDALEREFWRRRDVELVEMAPAEYAAELGRTVAAKSA